MGLTYVDEKRPGSGPTYTKPADYASKYQGNLDSALKGVTEFKYNPLEDASYRSLAKIYSERGNKAAKDTMGDAAALNGGYGTSYATSAAQQARNDYNMQLASMIPDLEEKAFNRNVQALGAYRDADNIDYGRYRDNVSDGQWQYTQNYQKWADEYANYWNAKNYNLDVYSAKKAEEARRAAASLSSGIGASGNSYNLAGGGLDIGYKDALSAADAAARVANAVAATGKINMSNAKKARNTNIKYSPAWNRWENSRKKK